uniref:Uncharacterized protein n=1 Tax=Oryza barthii TaxID=65489 RepID=A0A0D3H9P1_9ORYZ
MAMNALSTSSDAFLLSKHITYSIAAASQGSVILPSPPANPNSSCDILRSSTNTVVPRYGNGTSNRAPKHITYSIAAASQGSVILPSPPANPNSSCDILRSSTNTVVPRYGNGTSNRAPSDVYTAQWPLSATGDGEVDMLQPASSSSLAAAVLILCSFLAS